MSESKSRTKTKSKTRRSYWRLPARDLEFFQNLGIDLLSAVHTVRFFNIKPVKI